MAPIIGEREEFAGVGRVWTADDEHGFPTGDGYFVGVSYREALDARYLGVTLGMSLDMGTRRTKHRSSNDEFTCENCD